MSNVFFTTSFTESGESSVVKIPERNTTKLMFSGATPTGISLEVSFDQGNSWVVAGDSYTTGLDSSLGSNTRGFWLKVVASESIETEPSTVITVMSEPWASFDEGNTSGLIIDSDTVYSAAETQEWEAVRTVTVPAGMPCLILADPATESGFPGDGSFSVTWKFSADNLTGYGISSDGQIVDEETFEGDTVYYPGDTFATVMQGPPANGELTITIFAGGEGEDPEWPTANIYVLPGFSGTISGASEEE